MKIVFSVGIVIALILPALARADIFFFGTLNAQYAVVKENDIADYQFSGQGTRLGVKGASYLRDGLESRFIFELEPGLTDGYEPLQEVRQLWAGVRGRYGELRVGRHLSPARVAIDPVDLFNDQSADLNRVLESDTGFERSLAYINTFSNVGFAAVISDDDLNKLSTDVVLNYDNGPLYLATAYLAGSDDRDSLRAAAVWRFQGGHQLGVAYENLNDKTAQDDHHAYAINAAYHYQKTRFKAQYGWNNPVAVGKTETLLGLGADVQLNKDLVMAFQYSLNKHRDHTADDNERVITLGLSYQF